MPVNLHAGAKERMVQLLTEHLPNVRIQSNSFLVWSSLQDLTSLDRVVPGGNAELPRQLRAYIGEEPVWDFVVGRLSDELVTREFDSDAPLRSLIELPEYEDCTAVAERLVAELESLPWLYTLFTPVPYQLGQELRAAMGDHEYPLSDAIRLVRPEENLQQFQRDTGEQPRLGLLDAAPEGLNDEVLYLCASASGYIPGFGSSSPMQEFEMALRAFFGLTLALRFSRAGAYTFFGPTTRHVLVYRNLKGDQWKIESPHALPDEVSNGIRSLGVAEAFAKIPDTARTKILSDELAIIRVAFSDSRNDNLLRAAQWLFDSYCGGNQLLSFIQATISLEILLGEKAISDLVGLGELLANRCAYLIGVTRSQREEILADFRRIYSTRSKIVHAGHNRLSVADRSDLHTLRWMCSRVIREELKLVIAEGGSGDK